MEFDNFTESYCSKLEAWPTFSIIHVFLYMTDKIPTEYHKWYYDNEVWAKTSFLGIHCLKSVSDMWNYQEIICAIQPSLIIEFGTFNGGSALYYSTILKLIKAHSKVFSVDIKHSAVPEIVLTNPHIELLECSSTDTKVADRITELRNEFPGSVFAIIDSNHEASHVLAEMKLLRPLLVAGDYLIVEDSNINGHPVLENWGDGPMEAIQQYFIDFPNDYERDILREKKFGFTFAPMGYLYRK